MNKENKLNSWFKVIGLVGAVFLIVFGNIQNLIRTVKLVVKKEK